MPYLPARPDRADEIVARSTAITNAFDQTQDAKAFLCQPASAHLHLPFRAVDALVGGISPGNLWFLAAFSGNGKTAFLMSLALKLLALGKTVYYMGLESRPHLLMTQLACLRLGYDVGDVLSGAAKQWATWDSVRGELLADLAMQRALKSGHRFIVDGQTAIQAEGLEPALRDAALYAADLVIIDHIDHLQLAETGSAYEQSRRVTYTLAHLAHEYHLRLLVATQLNNSTVRGDRLAGYLPPLPDHVYMGGHKRQVATGMLGLFRPIRPDATKDERHAVRAGLAEPATILWPQIMGIVCMKHRYYGSREGQRDVLGIVRGRVDDVTEKDTFIP